MIVFITDLHFGVKGNNKAYFDEQMNFFETQFFPYLKSNNVTHVMCSGDVYDNRATVDWYILQELKRRFFGWFDDNGIVFCTIVGNHDMTFKNTLSHHAFKETFNEYTNCFYYDKPTTIEVGNYTIAMVPWILDEPILPKADILCLHSELKGFSYAKGIDCKHGFELSDLKSYKYVFNGHLHLHKEEKNIKNIGNPYQKDFGDFGEVKGFYHLKDNFELEFIVNTTSPRHLKLTYSEANGIMLYDSGDPKKITPEETIEICKNNHIKLITLDIDKQSKFDKFHQSLLASAKYIIEVIDNKEVINDTEVEQNIIQEASVMEVTKGYVEGMTHPEGIKNDRLYDVMTDLYQQASMEMI